MVDKFHRREAAMVDKFHRREAAMVDKSAGQAQRRKDCLKKALHLPRGRDGARPSSSKTNLLARLLEGHASPACNPSADG